MSKPDYLFLDCEWADVRGTDLVSIGVVSIDDSRYFYGECDILPADPTSWVREVVYPLLERGSSAMAVNVMSSRLRSFLDGFSDPLICYDFGVDRDLCERLLELEASATEKTNAREIRWYLMDETRLALKTWWRQHPEKEAFRHHALADARALRSAFLSLWGV